MKDLQNLCASNFEYTKGLGDINVVDDVALLPDACLGIVEILDGHVQNCF